MEQNYRFFFLGLDGLAAALTACLNSFLIEATSFLVGTLSSGPFTFFFIGASNDTNRD